MAKKHDEEQKKKNDGGGVEVARKFMNYIEFGMFSSRETVLNLFRFLEDEGFEGRVYG
jgi:hypothetical protein